MTAKHTYYKIDCEDSQALGLSGSDKDVYFFIRSYKEGCTMRQQLMAQMLCMPERSLRRSLQNLIARGLINGVNSGRRVNGGVVMTYCATPHGQIGLHPTAKNDVPHGQIGLHPNIICNTQSTDTSINTQSTDTSVVDARRAREEELQKNGAVLPVKDLTEELRQEILNGGSVYESANRLYGIGQEELLRYVGWFEDKLTMDSVSYKSRSDFRMHFNNWLRKQIQEKINQQHSSNGNHTRNHQPLYSDEFLAGIAADIASGR